jgi:anti-sigma factor RsiW
VTCRKFIEFLMEYLNGELSPQEHAEFEAHLAECPWCVAYMQTYQ